MKKSMTSFLVLFFCIRYSYAQTISFDAAAVRNQLKQAGGFNLSVFYHFTENFSAGIEVNRFFEQRKIKENSEYTISSWDYDCNAHYYFHLHKYIVLYPVTGFSVSVEKEKSDLESTQRNLLYFNTGAGILLNTKTVKPHFEYIYAHGKRNEQFLLAGITIELDLKK
jgi:hypothetical protein